MKTPTKFVAELSEGQREELRELMKAANEHVRRRAHAVLLSSRGNTVDQIADIYEVDRDTVSNWLDRWKGDVTDGLRDQEGRGRKPILNEKEQKQAIKIVEKDPRSSKRRRMIKYDWLPFKAYESFKDLVRSLTAVLKGVGSKYRINFAH